MSRTRPPIPGTFAGASRAGIRHDDYVASVVGFVEGRDLRDVVLVGHSFGGSVVSRVSQAIPERLRAPRLPHRVRGGRRRQRQR